MNFHHITNQKGSRVNPHARSAATPSPKTGIFATLAASLRDWGRGAPARRLAALTTVATAAALLLAAAPASALQTHHLIKSFSLPNGASPIELGINQSTEKIYVSTFGEHVYVFDAQGNQVGQLTGATFTNSYGVAVDNSGGANQGDIYVADYGAGSVTQFDPAGVRTAQKSIGAVNVAKDGAPQPAFPGLPNVVNNGGFQPTGVAVAANGDVYVADQANNVVDLFHSDGTFVAQIGSGHIGGPNGIALAPSGNLYVAQNASGLIEFGPSGACVNSCTPIDPAAALGTATDSVGNVYAEEGSRVVEFNSSGSQIGSFGSFSFGRGVAVNNATNDVYVADFGSGRVDLFGPSVVIPDAETGAATEITLTTAKLNGVINPRETEASYQFEYGTSTSYGEKAPASPAPVGNDNSNHPEGTVISGLQPSTVYHFRIDGINECETGETCINPGADATFRTTGAPTIEGASPTSVSGVAATIEAHVNPSGFDTHAWIEFGTTASYGSETSHEDLGGSSEAQTLLAQLPNLQPSTTYHFRVFAKNAQGEVEGSQDQTLETEPAARIEETSASDVSQTCALLHAQVNPDGSATKVFFEYGTTTAYGATSSNTVIGASNEPQNVEEEVCGLSFGVTKGTTYHFRAVATNSVTPPGGVQGPDRTFITLPAIGFAGLSATHIGAESATLDARLNPFGLNTEYRFQYLSEAQFQTEGESFANAKETAEADLGSGREFTVALAQIEGLKPQTSYVFRVLAHNASGSFESPPASFTTTAAEPAANECPNEQLRRESNLDPITERPYSTELADCRAFELVSATNKNLGLFATGRFAADGSRIFAEAVSIFDGSPGQSSLFSPYSLSRTPSGWRTTPLSVPASQYQVTEGANHQTTDSGEELRSLRPSGSLSGVQNLYRRSSPSGPFTEVGPLIPSEKIPPLPANDEVPAGATARTVGASSDLSHVVLASAPVWPGANSGEHSVYEYVGLGNSEPELVAVRNVGTVAAAAAAAHDQHLNEAAEPIGTCHSWVGEGSPSNLEARNSHNAVSADGETVFFTVQRCNGSPPVTELYARVGRALTVPISEPSLQSECHAECAEDATQVSNFRDGGFQGASADGSLVIFLSPQRLLDSASQDPNNDSPVDSNFSNCGRATKTSPNGCNLYAYDFSKPADERLIDLSAGDNSGSGPQVQGVGAISEDGSHVYFVAKGVLSGAANEFGATAEAGADNLYAYDTKNGHLSFVATLAQEDEFQWGALATTSMQTTPDGRYLLFTSHADPTPDASGEAGQLYRYDSATGHLNRISISEDGLAEDGNSGGGNVFIPRTGFPGSNAPNRDASPAISDDGSIVVFESRLALTPTALEGGHNAYEYESGHVHLLFTGVLGEPLTGITPSGQDIFLFTPNPLLPADLDTTGDIYDARVNGGFPAPPQLNPCHGDACQPGVAVPQQSPGPITPSFSGAEEGPGHAENPKRCKKGLVRKHGQCVKKGPHRKHKKRSQAGSKHGGHK